MGVRCLYYQLYKLPEPMGVLEHTKHPPGYATDCNAHDDVCSDVLYLILG